MKVTRLKLKKMIKELESIRGRHTELVSVYIPQGYKVIDVIGQLKQEQGTAANIKSKSTRKNVMGALEKAVQHLRLYKKTPENGIAVFSGNICENEGVADIKVTAIEPPEPLKVKLYWCDQVFRLEPLIDQVKERDIYGLIVLDNSEATIGFLRGKSIQVIKHMNSLVPGKFRKGGQCILPDTLIQKVDGSILPIKNIEVGSYIHNVDFDNPVYFESSKVVDFWSTKKNKVYKIITRYPRFEIESSKDHLFFVWNNGKIEERAAEDLEGGNFLLIPEKIYSKGSQQKLNCSIKLHPKANKVNRNVRLPKILDKKLAQIIGYFMGDGNFDDNRLCFSEGEKDIADSYERIIKEALNIKPRIRYREKKNYYETRIYSKIIVNFVKNNFFENKDSKSVLIPNKILISKNNVVGGFLRGFFDAEGYISMSGGRIGLGINNKILAKQIQIVLLRFGVLSSLMEYDNRRNKYSNNPRFTIEISEKKSLSLFEKSIGFESSRKKRGLKTLIKNKTEKSNVRKISISGREVRKIIEKSGINLEYFPKVSSFFNNKRMMSKNIFKKSILNVIKERIDLHDELKMILDYNIIPVKIHKINVIKKKQEFVDISVENQNFIANGIFVHNSAARFGRVREGMKHDWYKKIGDIVKSKFDKDIIGIILGGPGPAKQDFEKTDILSKELKGKIIAIRDTGYSSEHGLEELVKRSEDVLSEANIMKEKKLIEKFFSGLESGSNKVSYGFLSVLKALKDGSVELLMISEELKWKEIELECRCGFNEKRFVKIGKEKVECPKCEAVMGLLGDMDIIDAFEALVKNYGTKLEIISTESPEGEKFLQLGGIGAFLRWKV